MSENGTPIYKSLWYRFSPTMIAAKIAVVIAWAKSLFSGTKYDL